VASKTTPIREDGLDDAWQLVCGALSSNPAHAHESAAEIGLDPDRSYSTANAPDPTQWKQWQS
jgi:hypothetical protein